MMIHACLYAYGNAKGFQEGATEFYTLSYQTRCLKENPQPRAQTLNFQPATGALIPLAPKCGSLDSSNVS